MIVHLSSKDVIHSFGVPEFRVKQDAVPGLTIPVWWVPTVTTAEMRKRLGKPEFATRSPAPSSAASATTGCADLSPSRAPRSSRRGWPHRSLNRAHRIRSGKHELRRRVAASRLHLNPLQRKELSNGSHDWLGRSESGSVSLCGFLYFIINTKRGKARGHTWFTWWKPRGHSDIGPDIGGIPQTTPRERRGARGPLLTTHPAGSLCAGLVSAT